MDKKIYHKTISELDFINIDTLRQWAIAIVKDAIIRKQHMERRIKRFRADDMPHQKMIKICSDKCKKWDAIIGIFMSKFEIAENDLQQASQLQKVHRYKKRKEKNL